MIDINLLRQEPETVRQALINRQKNSSVVDEIVKLDSSRRELLSDVEKLRADQNALSRQFKGKPTDEQLTQATEIKNNLKEKETALKDLEDKQNLILEEIPNIPASDVPVGKDESENVVYKTVGEPTKFDFQPLDHADLGEKLDIIDVKKAAQVSGSRFGYFKGQGAVLEMAVMFYAFQKLIKKGFIGMIPPAMNNNYFLFIISSNLTHLSFFTFIGTSSLYNFALTVPGLGEYLFK